MSKTTNNPHSAGSSQPHRRSASTKDTWAFYCCISKFIVSSRKLFLQKVERPEWPSWWEEPGQVEFECQLWWFCPRQSGKWFPAQSFARKRSSGCHSDAITGRSKPRGMLHTMNVKWELQTDFSPFLCNGNGYADFGRCNLWHYMLNLSTSSLGHWIKWTCWILL